MSSYLIASDAKQTPLRQRSASFIYADPPHRNGWDYTHIDNYTDFAEQWIAEAHRLLAAHSYLIICVDNSTRYTYERLLQSYSVIELVQDLIWYYDFGTYTRRKFVQSHTTFLVYKVGRPTFYWEQVAERSQRMEAGDSRADWRGRTPGTMFAIPRVPGNSFDRRYIGQHRSCQPTELLETFVKAYTNNKRTDELVVDLFSGSGSMAKACQKLGRLCVSMDIEEMFVKQVNQRVHHDWERFIREDT